MISQCAARRCPAWQADAMGLGIDGGFARYHGRQEEQAPISLPDPSVSSMSRASGFCRPHASRPAPRLGQPFSSLACPTTRRSTRAQALAPQLACSLVLSLLPAVASRPIPPGSPEDRSRWTSGSSPRCCAAARRRGGRPQFVGRQHRDRVGERPGSLLERRPPAGCHSRAPTSANPGRLRRYAERRDGVLLDRLKKPATISVCSPGRCREFHHEFEVRLPERNQRSVALTGGWSTVFARRTVTGREPRRALPRGAAQRNLLARGRAGGQGLERESAGLLRSGRPWSRDRPEPGNQAGR